MNTARDNRSVVVVRLVTSHEAQLGPGLLVDLALLDVVRVGGLFSIQDWEHKRVFSVDRETNSRESNIVLRENWHVVRYEGLVKI